MSSSRASFLVYWERQESALCGTHCINNLLQGPYYSEIGMADIARGLDERERALMMEGGVDSSDYLSWMGRESANVDESGNFSIEVLKEALNNFGLSCDNITAPECRDALAAPTDQTAFVCHLREHWIALRQLGGQWFDLNSLQHANDQWGPSSISRLYLDAYLHQLREQRYTIFVVNGNFPPIEAGADSQGRGTWYDSEEIIAVTKNPKAKRQKMTHTAAAGGASMSGNFGGDDDLARAIAASMSTSSAPATSVWPGAASAAASAMDEDEELRRALQLSLQEATTDATATTNTPPAAAPSAQVSSLAAAAGLSASTAAAATPAVPSVSPDLPLAAVSISDSANAAAAAAGTETTGTSARTDSGDMELVSQPPQHAAESSPDDEDEDEEAEMRRAIALSLQAGEAAS